MPASERVAVLFGLSQPSYEETIITVGTENVTVVRLRSLTALRSLILR